MSPCELSSVSVNSQLLCRGRAALPQQEPIRAPAGLSLPAPLRTLAPELPSHDLPHQQVLRVCSSSSGPHLTPFPGPVHPPHLAAMCSLENGSHTQALPCLKMSGRLHAPLGSAPQPITDSYRAQNPGFLASGEGGNSVVIPSPGLPVDQAEVGLQLRPHPC